MAEINLLRHWGRREYVDEVFSDDSDSEFGGPLFTIQEDEEDYEDDEVEEGEEEVAVVGSDEESKDDAEEDVYDQEYGNENEDSDLPEDDNVKTLYGDSDTETTVHDSTAHSTSTLNNNKSSDNVVTNHSLLQVSQPSHRMGSHNYIPATATASSTNGKYRTVSVFGGILDLADPTDTDGDSFSSDGFSDDEWSVEVKEEVAPKKKATSARSTQAPTDRIEFQSSTENSNAPNNVIPETSINPTTKEQNELNDDKDEDQIEPSVKETLVSKVNESIPLPPETSLPQSQSSEEVDADGTISPEEDDTESNTPVGDIETKPSNITDIPKSIDLSQFMDKPVKERQGLLTSFLNELCFLKLPEEVEEREEEDLSRKNSSEFAPRYC